MFLWDWFNSILSYLGLGKKSGKLLFLGLENAGKTSLLHMLKYDRMGATLPTLHPTSEELTIGKIKFTTFDLGGHKQAIKVWKDYFPAVDGIVFLVDVTDKKRFLEAKKELNSLLDDEQLKNCPILILANKIDKDGAVSESEIIYNLGIFGLKTGKEEDGHKDQRPLELFMCSIVKKQGYGEGFRWISQFLE